MTPEKAMRQASKKKIRVAGMASFALALVPLGGWLLPNPFGFHGDDERGRFGGQWRGTIVQPSGERWDLDITIDVARKTGHFSVASTTMRCAGDLTVLPDSAGRLRILERLTRTDLGTCTPSAYITLSPESGHVHVTWQDAAVPSITGSGDLTRG